MLRGIQAWVVLKDVFFWLELYLEMFKANSSFWKTSAIHNFAKEIKYWGSLCHHIWLLDIIGWVSTTTPLGLSLASLSGVILLVRLIGSPESRGERKDSENSIPALGDRGPALIQASLTMTCFFILSDDSLMQKWCSESEQDFEVCYCHSKCWTTQSPVLFTPCLPW